MKGRPRLRLSTVLLGVLAVVWLYPVVWTLANAIKSSADVYRAPWDIPWPPAVDNISEAWARGQLGVALVNSTYVTAMTVAGVLGLAVLGAYSLALLRPPFRFALFMAVLAPLIVPTEVLIVPLFSMFRTLGLVNSLPGLALSNVAANVSFATIILTGYFRVDPPGRHRCRPDRWSWQGPGPGSDGHPARAAGDPRGRRPGGGVHLE